MIWKSLLFYLGVVTVDVIQDPDEDVLRDVVQGHCRDAGLRLQRFTLAKMILQQGLEIITAATEKDLLGG